MNPLTTLPQVPVRWPPYATRLLASQQGALWRAKLEEQGIWDFQPEIHPSRDPSNPLSPLYTFSLSRAGVTVTPLAERGMTRGRWKAEIGEVGWQEEAEYPWGAIRKLEGRARREKELAEEGWRAMEEALEGPKTRGAWERTRRSRVRRGQTVEDMRFGERLEP